jgi:hypothetical protein
LNAFVALKIILSQCCTVLGGGQSVVGFGDGGFDTCASVPIGVRNVPAMKAAAIIVARIDFFNIEVIANKT